MLQYNPTITGSLQVLGDITGTVNGINITGLSQSVSTQLISVQVSTGSSDAKFETLSGVTSSALTRLTNIESKSASVDISISNINSITASNIARLSNLETKSSSVDISISNINSFTSSNAIASLNSKTGSYATTGSNSFYGTQVFSGSVYIANDLVVQGSSSIQYISASSVSIGTNIVQLNTATPSVRFAGLTIIDSGSIGGSGSFLYDSVHDEFVFVHRGNGTNVTSSHFVLGPETYDSLGNETYLTTNILTKGTGKEHLVDSCIFDNGTTTCIKNNLVTTGTISGTTIYGSTAVCSTLGLFSGCVGIGISPQSILETFGASPIITITDSNAFSSGVARTSGIEFKAFNPSGNITTQSAGIYGVITPETGYTPNQGYLTFYTRLQGCSYTEKMRITSGGNVIIGNTVASNAVLTIYGSNAATIYQTANTCTGPANGFYVGHTGDISYIWNYNNYPIIIATCNTERISITSKGNIGIGTTIPVCTSLIGSMTIVKSYNGDTPTSTTAQTYDINQSNLYLFGRNAGLTMVGNQNEESVIAFGNPYAYYIGGIRMGMGSGVAGGDMVFQTCGSCERIRISSDGSMGFNNSIIGSRSFVFKALTSRPIVIEAIENCGVHSMFFRPNNSGYNLVSSNYLSGGTYLPLSLSARENNGDLVLATNGNVGVAIGAPSQKLHVVGGFLQTAGNSSWYRNVFEVNPTSWTNVVGFSPQSNPQYTYGYINITASAYTNGTSAGGVTTSRWYYSITNNSISVSVNGSDIVTGSQAPGVRLTVSSGTIYAQVQSCNGTSAAYTSVFVDAMLASGYVNGTYWTIA